MKKYIIYSIILFLTYTYTGCDKDTNFLDDPNSVPPSQLNVNNLLNSIQIDFNKVLIGDADSNTSLNEEARKFTRMEYQFGTYSNSAETYNETWINFYAGMLKDIRVMTPLAQAKGQLNHIGVAQLLEAYGIVTMVDFFGNIPYSEAINDNILHPIADDDQAVYNYALSLIDQSIPNLSAELSDDLKIENDLYYKGNMSNWIKLANSLKLKIYVQTKNVNPTLSASKINDILAENNYIDEMSEDFQFTFGTNISNPDTRHPLYSKNYNGSGASNYISNSYMYALTIDNDPRLRYYFYRQNTSAPVGDDLVCTLPPNPPYTYCYIGNGYRGRDHATNAGIPDDARRRTNWGLYPVGGTFDISQPDVCESGDGAKGAGINPILLSSYLKFMIAEAGLTIPGVTADPLTSYQQGIEQSIAKVMSFKALEGAELSSFEPSTTTVNNFITTMSNRYNAASGTNAKLEQIMKQYWVALWGNGIEAYNNYRRTGLPKLQSPQVAGTVFPRVISYPSNYVNYNANAVQHPVTTQVFWDTNPAGFID